jgi:hypothetical protein
MVERDDLDHLAAAAVAVAAFVVVVAAGDDIERLVHVGTSSNS